MKRKPVILLAIILMITLLGLPVFADDSYPPAKPLPNLAGNNNYMERLISVCESQLGYTESASGNSIYAVWAGQSGRAWCSEFVAWCARQAGISEVIIPSGTSTRKYMEVFSRQDRLYILAENTDSCTCWNYTKKTKSFNDIQRGDLIFTETDGNYYNGPDHTALVLSREGNLLNIINGNSNNSVRTTTCSMEKIHCVARPCYEKAASAVMVKNTKLKLKVSKVRSKSIRVKYTDLNDKNVRYQIAYRISGSKKWYFKDTSKNTIKLKKLKRKKKYTIRVRPFYKVSNNQEDIEYGQWSKKKRVRTRK